MHAPLGASPCNLTQPYAEQSGYVQNSAGENWGKAFPVCSSSTEIAFCGYRTLRHLMNSQPRDLQIDDLVTESEGKRVLCASAL